MKRDWCILGFCVVAVLAIVLHAALASPHHYRFDEPPQYSGVVTGRVWCPRCQKWREGRWTVHEQDGRLVLPECLGTE